MCAVLDAFCFYSRNQLEAKCEEEKTALVEMEEQEEEEEGASASEEEEDEDIGVGATAPQADAATIAVALQRRILPPLLRLALGGGLKSDTAGKAGERHSSASGVQARQKKANKAALAAQAPVAVAALKLLQLLPRAVEEVTLPRVLLQAAGGIGSKDPNVREASGNTLAACVAALGPGRGPPAAAVALRGALPRHAAKGGGFQTQAIGHALRQTLCRARDVRNAALSEQAETAADL